MPAPIEVPNMSREALVVFITLDTVFLGYAILHMLYILLAYHRKIGNRLLLNLGVQKVKLLRKQWRMRRLLFS